MEVLRLRVYQLLEGRDSADKPAQLVQLCILGLILISVIAVVLESMPWARDRFGAWLTGIEFVTIAVFTIEFAARVWSCTASDRYGAGWRGRSRFVRTPMAVIDLLAILPFYLSFFTVDTRYLRLFRMLRILRIARLARYLKAMRVLGRVIVAKRFELGVTLLIGSILLVVSAGLMYFAEHDAQPDKFSSIPATMWWAIATLTTVGYGDMTPVTPLGRLAGGLVAIVGIGMFALPTAILGAAFVDELSSEDKGVRTVVCPKCGNELTE